MYGYDNAEKVSDRLSCNRSGGKGTSPDNPATTKKNIPIIMWPRHKEQGVMHYPRDSFPKDEKDKLFDELRGKKNDGVKRTANKDKF